TSVLIDYVSYFDEPLLGSTDGYQLCLLRNLWFHLLRFFAHLRNFYPLQNSLYAFVDLAQRFANVASDSLITFAANCDAGGDKQGAINNLNHFESGNCVCRASQRIAAIRAMLGVQKACP